MSEAAALLWNQLLSGAAVLNILVALVVVPIVRATPTPPSAKLPPLWVAVWSSRRLLCFIYVLACAVRSIWPRFDGNRVCFWDHPLSPVMIGRSLATVAELSFAALVSGCIARTVNTPVVHRACDVWLAVNVVAQSCCWFSVITRHQLGHVVEESIWLVSGATMWLTCALAVYGRWPQVSSSKHAQAFLKGILVTGVRLHVCCCMECVIVQDRGWRWWSGDGMMGRVCGNLQCSLAVSVAASVHDCRPAVCRVHGVRGRADVLESVP